MYHIHNFEVTLTKENDLYITFDKNEDGSTQHLSDTINKISSNNAGNPAPSIKFEVKNNQLIVYLNDNAFVFSIDIKLSLKIGNKINVCGLSGITKDIVSHTIIYRLSSPIANWK